MIAWVVSEKDTPRTPVSYALEYAGFEARDVFTIDEVDRALEFHGIRDSVVVIGTQMLSERRGRQTWMNFLEARPELMLVVVSLARANDSAREIMRVRSGILVEEPFDAAAVVTAVYRAVGLSLRTAEPVGRARGRAA
jgi:DNA-binding NtrC family response regulator